MGFPHKVCHIRTKKQISFLPLRESNSDLECRSPQLGPQNSMAPLILNTNFIKGELIIGYQQELDLDRLIKNPQF